MANENVIYIDPEMNFANLNVSKGLNKSDEITPHKYGVFNYTPPLEDYCISIDFEVEIKDRQGGKTESGGKKLLLSWSSNKGSISFLSGRQMSFKNCPNSKINYLTTAPMEMGTFDDVVNGGTNEAFGINSINISYNSYMVPEVTIEFVDIRGISLFSPEELRHEGVNENGMHGCVDEDIAGSFFKCFFTFPYPVFRIMIKGFYGEPTTYELCCSDFRAKFDCNTGNFGATAKFVGYAYSMLNNITMNAVVISPYSEYYGKEYWEKRIGEKNGFVLDNGTPMPTFIELIPKVKSLKNGIETSSEIQAVAEKATEISNSTNYLVSITDAYEIYFNELLNAVKENSPEKSFLSSQQEKSIVIFNDTETIGNENITKMFEKIKTVKEKYDILVNAINTYKNNTSASVPNVSPFSLELTSIENNSNKLKNREFTKDYASQVDSKYHKFCYFYDGYALSKYIQDKKKTNSTEISSTQDEMVKIKQKMSTDYLGFNPTVQNLTAILMAHLDTLMHCIYRCSKDVSDSERKPEEVGVNKCDIKINDFLPPFPKIEQQKIENGVTITEEGWIGELVNGKNEPESKLIESLLNAIKENADTFNTAQNLSSGSTETKELTSMAIPLTPMDTLIDKNPFGDDLDVTNFPDFVGRLGLRMANIFILNGIRSNGKELGKLDAINFHEKYPKLSITLINKLKNVDNIKPTIMKMLTNSDVSEKGGTDSWPWDVTDTESKGMYAGNETLFRGFNLYKNKIGENKEIQYIPTQGISWKEINNDFLNSSYPSGDRTDYYVTTYSLKNVKNKSLFKIDLDIEKYDRLYNLMNQSEETKVPNSEDYNMIFNSSDYIDSYFDLDECIGKKFIVSSDWKASTFDPQYNNWLLPKEKPKGDFVKSFDDGSGYDSDFNKIKVFNTENNEVDDVDRDDSNTDDFESVMTNSSNYIVKTFYGFDDEFDIEEDTSIFGNMGYYSQSDNVRAIMFLETFQEDNCIDIIKAIDRLCTYNEYRFLHIPYYSALLIGGYYWLQQKKEQGNVFNFTYFDKDELNSNGGILIDDSDIKKLFKLRFEIQKEFLDLFENWVKSENGFKYIKANFEIHSKSINDSDLESSEKTSDNNINFIKAFVKLCDNDEDYDECDGKLDVFLTRYLDDKFYENYISLKCDEDNGIKLFLRESATAVKKLTSDLFKPCVLVKGSVLMEKEYRESAINSYLYSNYEFGNYIDGFVEKINTFVETTETNSNTQTPIAESDTDYNIRVSLYKYIKLLWDRWLSGTDEEFWHIESFFRPNWFFIDSFYNKIGDLCVLDIGEFISDIAFSQSNNGYTLLSFISNSYAKNKFSFHCVQNFVDLVENDGVTRSKMNRMFLPISHNDIDFSAIKKHPSFILLYPNEYSSKLNIEDSNNNVKYYGDSFDISKDDENLPLQIRTKTKDSGYKIPAFGVTYGQQYQHYFKNIDVSMETPIITEQSLQAQFMIAGALPKDGENGGNVVTLGQDLYTIYSNNSYTCTVTMMGCAWIQPLMYFQLNNVPLFRGAYLIQKVTHRITPGNMETTFVGVRMANTSSPKVKNWCHVKKNNENGGYGEYSEAVNYENKLARIDNDCEYKFFNPNEISSEGGVPVDELNMTLKQYADYKKDTWNISVTSSNDVNSVLLRDFLIGSAYKEAGNQDALGIQLACTVIFNRYCHNGRNFTKLYYDSQHEFLGKGGTANYNDSGFNEFKTNHGEEVIKIFSQTPSVLIGRKAKILRSIPIYDKGVKTSQPTSGKTITEHDVKSMDGYDTTNGYDITYQPRKNSKGKPCCEPFGWWQRAKYNLQHDNLEKNTYGHVFVAGAYVYDKEHWQIQPKKTDTWKGKSPSELASNLFNCIKQSANYANITETSTMRIQTVTSDVNTIYINCSDRNGLAVIFDIALNTYYDYISNLCWCVSNDGSELPTKIKITCSDEPSSRKIGIYKYTSEKLSNGSEVLKVNPLNTHVNLNDKFYKSIKKRVGVLDESNSNEFKTIYVNFIDLINKESSNNKWVSTVNTLLGNSKVTPCGEIMNTPAPNGYTWDGSSHPNNNISPSQSINGGSLGNNFIKSYISKISRLCKSNLSKGNEERERGKCAGYVRRALMECENPIQVKEFPFSACVYSKFLPIWGFTLIYDGIAPNMSGYSPIHGDIAVIAGRTNGGDSDKHGHIQIYVENEGWFSDFIAKTVWCYGDAGRPYKIYRWGT